MTEQNRKRRNWRDLQAMRRAKEQRADKPTATATGKTRRNVRTIPADKLNASNDE